MSDGSPQALARKRRTPLFVAIAVVAAVAIAAAGALALQDDSDSPDLAGNPDGVTPQPLAWQACGKGLECAELSVPLDHADQGGRQIALALNRRAATDPAARLGALVINPGGPGGSGVAFVRDSVEAISADVRARYDIVGFDPRGVGSSNPVDCLSDADLDDYLAAEATPDTPAEVTALEDDVRRFAAGCEARSGEVLPHLSTLNVARDLEIIRGALGQARLDYLGYSYGSYLGAVYAEEFPDRVGRLVLDGALDPTLTGEELILGQARGFELAYTSFVDACLDQRRCPLGSSAAGIARQVTALLAELDTRTLPTVQERPLTQSLAASGIFFAMYESAVWEFLQEAIVAAFDGDGSGLLQIVDLFLERNDDGTYAGNLLEANAAVNCLDRPSGATAEEIAQRLPELREISPLFGEYLAWGAFICQIWPVPPQGEPRPLPAAGAPSILVIGTTRDPATPYEDAQALAEQLESGVLLTLDGDGHTAYGRGNACIDAAVDAYLLAGTPPADGTRCDGPTAG